MPFNEGWGQFDAARVAGEVRELDPTRPVDHASGWHDQGAGDLRSLHVYFRRLPAARVAAPRTARALVLTRSTAATSSRVAGHAWSSEDLRLPHVRRRGRLRARLPCGCSDAQIVPAVEQGLAAHRLHPAHRRRGRDQRAADLRPAGAQAGRGRRTRIEPATAQPVRARDRCPCSAVEVHEREITEPVVADPARRTAEPRRGRMDPDAVGHHRRDRVAQDRAERDGPWPGRTGRAGPQQALGVLDRHHPDAHRRARSLRPRLRRRARTVAPRSPDRGGRSPTTRSGSSAGACTCPATLGRGQARGRTRKVRDHLDEVPGGTRLRARPASAYGSTSSPIGRRATSAWPSWCPGPTGASSTRSRTSPDRPRARCGSTVSRTTSRPASRGPCSTMAAAAGPTTCSWNWGAGSGRTDGRVVGIQVGGRWTDGTGSIENALLRRRAPVQDQRGAGWDYDTGTGWRRGRSGATPSTLTFTPFHLKESVTDLKVFSSRTHQCFGHWTGRVRDDTGSWVAVAEGSAGPRTSTTAGER